jgi:hypothetical protein
MPGMADEDRRRYDVQQLSDLLRADIELAIFDVLPDGNLPAHVRDKVLYWIGRTWDAGRWAGREEKR